MDKQSRCIFTLPSDIVLEVVAYLSKRDCLTCMAVCHEWYNKIPQYTRIIWKELRLNILNLPEEHKRLERCLGSHVKHVAISQPIDLYAYGIMQPKPPYCAMQKLIDWQCNAIEFFELEDGNTETATFVDLLVRLAPQLSHLHLWCHRSPVDFLLLLHAFPDLTNLFCRNLITGPGFFSSVHFSNNTPIDFTTKLTYLSLCDSYLSVQQKELLVKRCPNLQCYLDSQMCGTLQTVDLDSLFQWCPKINVYSLKYTNKDFHHSGYSTYISSDVPGLRYFYAKTLDGIGVDKVVRQLAKNKDTLEYFALCNYRPPYDWPQTHGFVQLTNLRALYYSGPTLGAQSFVTILNHCPLLEIFDMLGSLTLDSRSIRSLGTSHSLCNFKCYRAVLSQDLSLLTLMEHFPALERLELKNTTLPPRIPPYFEPPKNLKQLAFSVERWIPDAGDGDQCIAILNFFKVLTSSSKLEDLRLLVNVLPGPLLSEIVSMPTLKHLEISFDRRLQDKHLEEFIKALQHTVVETLKLNMVFRLSLVEFSALADLQQLVTIRLNGPGSHIATRPPLGDPDSCPRVSKEGLSQILQKSPKLATFMLNKNFVMVNEEQQVELDPTNILLEQLVSNILDTTSRHWDVQSPDSMIRRAGTSEEQTYHIITRVDK